MEPTTVKGIIQLATERLQRLNGEVLNVVEVVRPTSVTWVSNLSRIISKLSPFVANSIEFLVVDFLNGQPEFKPIGEWSRQDPGFPDVILNLKPGGPQLPTPGLEVKAWFPLATEITGRFKTADVLLEDGRISVAVLAWLPEYLLFGKPKLIDVCVVPGLSVAKARNTHYFSPPHYLVVEPEETSNRTVNLQQSNTEGYRLQDDSEEVIRAAAEKAKELELFRGGYQSGYDYRSRVNQLRSAFRYRLDTNFSKIDRIEHAGIEDFKQKVYDTEFWGRTIGDWNGLFNPNRRTIQNRQKLVDTLCDALGDHLGPELTSHASKRLIP